MCHSLYAVCNCMHAVLYHKAKCLPGACPSIQVFQHHLRRLGPFKTRLLVSCPCCFRLCLDASQPYSAVFSHRQDVQSHQACLSKQQTPRGGFRHTAHLSLPPGCNPLTQRRSAGLKPSANHKLCYCHLHASFNSSSSSSSSRQDHLAL